MFAVQQHVNNNGFVPDALKQGLVLQAQGQQQAWVQAGGHPQTHMLLRASGPQQVGLAAHQAPQQVSVYQQAPQQVRMAQMPLRAAQVQSQQQQQFVLATQQQLTPQPAGAGNCSMVQDGSKQVVYVNVGGALRRGIVQNGAVYLLPEDAAMLGGRPQVSAVQMANGGQALTTVQPQTQQQQPMMIQQVMPNGQLVPVSGAMVGPRAGVQLLGSQQVQMQPQAAPAQLQARAMPTMTLGFSAEMQQHQQMLRMDVGATAATATQRMMPANIVASPFAANAGANARMLPQQATVLQVPQGVARGPVPQAGIATGPGHFGAPLASALPASNQMHGGTSVSASTASLMPRMPATSTAVAAQAPGTVPLAGSQPMTIAAALAALPTNATQGGAPAPAAAVAGSELCSPVAPPGTPGMCNAAPVGSGAVSTIGAVINKLSATDAGTGAGPAILSGPPVIGAATGSSPLTSQPGTPPRSNSLGHHSNSSSSSGGSQGASADGDAEAKAGVMRMLARTFIETGIGLQQALSMIQPADADMLAAAFAAEVAASAAGGAGASAPVKEAPVGGVAASGADLTNTTAVPRAETAGLGLSNPSFTSSVSGGQDNCSMGSWGFSLFSNVTSDIGSQQGVGSFGGIGEKVMGGSPACGADAATATMFANLHV